MDRDWRRGAKRESMDGDWRRRAPQESGRDRDFASFHRDVAPYEGTSRDFDVAHHQRYGQEERMGPDGRHRKGPKPTFPDDSDRHELWKSYDQSTNDRDKSREAYQTDLTNAYGEYRDMSADEQAYYRRSGGLRPDQHERLDPRATQYRDSSYSNATGRETFLKSHPHGYHSMEEQIRHHGYASKAYGEYEYASTQQKHHEKHRSYSNVDKRKDPYGRPVSRR